MHAAFVANPATVRAQAHADAARANAVYLMGAGAWSCPTFMTIAGHKPEPRWDEVRIS